MSLELKSIDDNHVPLVWSQDDFGYKVICSCGAMWTHPKNTTPEKIQSIYESHVAYCKHEPMKVL